ncbi:MAG: hypothetical protein JSV69_04605 [Chloroflexota bacterium]|nr:MAG: hypothetical protein JSV69_04605 [Chloroflexota bacterium]
MKRIILLITGLVGGTILALAVLLLTGLAVAQEVPDSESDVLDLVVTPWVSDAAEEGIETVSIIIQPESESMQETDSEIISITVTADKNAGLPGRQPEAMGVLLEATGDSYLIGPYATRLVDGKGTCARPEGGKVKRVSVTDLTRFVEDVTDFSQAKPLNGPSDLHVQQVLKSIQQPIEIPGCASMLVWGEWHGDRLIAEVIFFHDES